jgi:hypothetical protein
VGITQINVSSPANEILFNDSALGAVVDAVKASSANLYYIVVDNSLNGAASYVKLFNLAAGSITLGSTPPDEIIYVPANSRLEQLYFSVSAFGKVFPTALSAACVTTGGTSGTVAPTSNVSVTLSYT